MIRNTPLEYEIVILIMVPPFSILACLLQAANKSILKGQPPCYPSGNVYNINFMLGIFGKPESIHYFANTDRGIDTSGILIMDYGKFKASCIAAKDCKAPSSVMIQGDKGYIISTETMNKATKFSIVLNDGSCEELEFADDHHRLYYEFEAFIDMVDNKDYETASKMLQLSVEISEIMEEARWKQRIVFGSDRISKEDK